MLHFDEYEFEKTAEVLVQINKSLFENQNITDKDDLISFMKSMASQYLYDKPGTFSTGGFVLTGYIGSDGKHYIRASVSAYCVQVYISAVRDRLQNILQPV